MNSRTLPTTTPRPVKGELYLRAQLRTPLGAPPRALRPGPRPDDDSAQEHQARRHYLRPINREFGRRLLYSLYTRALTWAARLEFAAYQDFRASQPQRVAAGVEPISHMPQDDTILADTVAPVPRSDTPMGIFHAVWVNTERGTWGPAGTADPDRGDEQTVTVETEEDAIASDADLGLLSTSLLLWTPACLVQGFDFGWEPGHEPGWLQDASERLQMDIDRGASQETLCAYSRQRVEGTMDRRFIGENEQILNFLYRAIMHHVPLQGDVVLQRMGPPSWADLCEESHGLLTWFVNSGSLVPGDLTPSTSRGTT